MTVHVDPESLRELASALSAVRRSVEESRKAMMGRLSATCWEDSQRRVVEKQIADAASLLLQFDRAASEAESFVRRKETEARNYLR